MAETSTSRLGLPQWSAGSDPHPDRVKTNQIYARVDSQVVVFVPTALLKDRPPAGVQGRAFCASDQGTDGRVYFDTGSKWVALNTTGGGGPGRNIVIGGAGSEGSSLQSARADHAHAIPLATKDNAGAMASQWAELCENASVTASAGSVAVRDSGGRLTAQRPVSAQHVVTLDYLSSAGSTGPQGGLAARTSSGQMSVNAPLHPLHAANKGYVDNAATGSTGPQPGLMARNGNGNSSVEDPSAGLHIANKRYVDSRASRREWKTNIEPIPYGLAELLDLKMYRWDYRKSAPATGEDEMGAMVDELAQVMPLLVEDGDDGEPERARDRQLIPVLVKAVQDLAGLVDELREQVQGQAIELDNLYEMTGGDDA